MAVVLILNISEVKDHLDYHISIIYLYLLYHSLKHNNLEYFEEFQISSHTTCYIFIIELNSYLASNIHLLFCLIIYLHLHPSHSIIIS